MQNIHLNLYKVYCNRDQANSYNVQFLVNHLTWSRGAYSNAMQSPSGNQKVKRTRDIHFRLLQTKKKPCC